VRCLPPDKAGSGPSFDAPKKPPQAAFVVEGKSRVSAFSQYVRLKNRLLATPDWIYQHQMTTISGGNLSIREANGAIWTTSARVEKGIVWRVSVLTSFLRGNPSSRPRFVATSIHLQL
jgi:hypothetical protein